MIYNWIESLWSKLSELFYFEEANDNFWDEDEDWFWDER